VTLVEDEYVIGQPTLKEGPLFTCLLIVLVSIHIKTDDPSCAASSSSS